MSGIIQKLHVESDTREALEKAFDLALSWSPHTIASWMQQNPYDVYDAAKQEYQIVDRPRLLLSSTLRTHVLWSPFLGGGMSGGALAQSVWGWLNCLDDSAWGPAPDCDGSVKHGWRLESGESWEYDLIVTPCWTEYHK